MRSLVVCLAVLSLAGPACKKSNNNPAGPSEAVVFTAQLLPANEVPLVTNSEASGSGSVTITLNTNRDSGGNVTDANASFQVSMTGLPATTTITMAHIHEGAAGVAGPIQVNTGIASGDVPLSNGAGTFQRNAIPVSAAVAQAMINTPSGWYFNVHSAANGPGVARGQLVKQ